MLERVKRANEAMKNEPRVIPGITRCHGLPDPEIGSQRRFTPKMRISRMPSQKLGMD